MGFLSKILTLVLNILVDKIVNWGISEYKRKEDIDKAEERNSEAVDKVKDSKTKEEVDDALDAIGRRTSDK